MAHKESDLLGYWFDFRDGSLVHDSMWLARGRKEKEDMEDAEGELFCQVKCP